MPSPKIPFYYFICFMNRDRSPTAARVAKQMAKEKGLEIETDSAGIHMSADNPITKGLLEDADKIFVMQPYMKKSIVRAYEISPEKIYCLDISDKYHSNSDTLKRILREKLEWLF